MDSVSDKGRNNQSINLPIHQSLSISISLSIPLPLSTPPSCTPQAPFWHCSLLRRSSVHTPQWPIQPTSPRCRGRVPDPCSSGEHRPGVRGAQARVQGTGYREPCSGEHRPGREGSTGQGVRVQGTGYREPCSGGEGEERDRAAE